MTLLVCFISLSNVSVVTGDFEDGTCFMPRNVCVCCNPSALVPLEYRPNGAYQYSNSKTCSNSDGNLLFFASKIFLAIVGCGRTGAKLLNLFSYSVRHRHTFVCRESHWVWVTPLPNAIVYTIYCSV